MKIERGKELRLNLDLNKTFEPVGKTIGNFIKKRGHLRSYFLAISRPLEDQFNL